MSTANQKEKDDVAGLVKYAMPHSCLLSDHFSQLLKRREQMLGIELDVLIQSSMDVLNAVSTSRVDFGFATNKIESSNLDYTPFCCEEYVLVAKKDWPGFSADREVLAKKGFIHFPGSETYGSHWLKAAFGEERQLELKDLNISGECNSIDGAILMISGGLGYSFIPRHCVESLTQNGQVTVHELLSPVLNQIYIVQKSNHKQPAQVSTVIQWFFDMLKE